VRFTVGVVTGWGGAVCAPAAVGAVGSVGVMVRGVMAGVVVRGGSGVVMAVAAVVDAEPCHCVF